MRAGFIFTPSIITLPFLHASAAIDLVLNIRAAHNHLSSLASIKLMIIYLKTDKSFEFTTMSTNPKEFIYKQTMDR
jgi:hypothetical protein